ncbi:MAG: YdcF family protein [Propionibacteriaceae bacterium]|nr:YdcF family protein [Propionibacteriaceae bacterium]
MALLIGAAFFFIVFLIRVLIDPRVMRAGVYLLVAVTLAVGGLFWQIIMWMPHREWLAYGLLAVLGLIVLFIVVMAVMLLLNGVTMLRREGHRLANTLSALVGLLFLGELLWAGLAIINYSDVMLAWLAVMMLPTAYFSFGYLAYVVYSWVYQLGARWFARPTPIVLVLGSGLIKGQVPRLLASRLNQGKALLARSDRQGLPGTIVVSGGQGSNESRSEAAAMGEYLRRSGIRPDRIIEEDRSRNTAENLANSEQLLAAYGLEGRVAVVTNNFHAFRSAMLMRRLGLPGYVIGSSTASYYWPSASIREFVAIVRDHPAFTITVLVIFWIPVVLLAAWVTLAG